MVLTSFMLLPIADIKAHSAISGMIRPYLSEKATAILVRSLILSKLDYVNSLLYGMSEGLLDKLQRIQNNAARLVYRKKKFDHVTPLMKELHWLPVRQRIEFR